MESFDPNSEKYDLNFKEDPKILYIIASIPRSGSTLLSTALWETGIAGFPHEYFHNEKHMRILSDRWNAQNDEDYIHKLFNKRTGSNGIFGFKAHFYQFNENFNNKILERILPSMKYVYIKRKDNLKQAISFARAIQTKRWLYDQIEIKKPNFNFLQIEDCLSRIKEEEIQWEQYFLKNKICPFSLTYEDLISNYDSSIIEILKFLNIHIPEKFKINQIPIKKQSDQINSEWFNKYSIEKKDRLLSSDKAENSEIKNDLEKENLTDCKNHFYKKSEPLIAAYDKDKSGGSNFTQPKISVVIFSYNFQNYIFECIESILAQTLSPLEIIISDDHSTDNSYAIIKKFLKKYPDMIRAYQHEKNIGHQKNANFALSKAAGDYIARIDGDDRWLPEKLEAEFKLLNRHPECKIAYSNVYTIDENGNRTGIWDSGVETAPPSGDVFIQTFSKNFFPKHTSVFRNELVHRTVHEKIGEVDENIQILVDWDLKIRATANYHVAYTNEALVEYRLHKGGIHNSLPDIRYKDILRIYKKNKHLLDSRTDVEKNSVKNGIKNKLKAITPEKNHIEFSPEEENILSELGIQNMYRNINFAEPIKGQLMPPYNHVEKREIDNEVQKLNSLGENLYQEKNIEGAKELFLKAANMDRGFPIPHNNLGVIFWNEGKIEKSIKHLEASLEINPDYQSAVFNLVSVLYEINNIVEAREIIFKYLKMNPGDTTIKKLAEKICSLENENDFCSEMKNTKSIAPFIINSLPKSGTHLLTKALDLFPGIKSSGIWIEHANSKKYKIDEGFGSTKIPIGIDWPKQVNLSEIEKEFQKINPGQFLIGHIPYSQELSETIKKNGIKTLLILRDPRDVVVSHAKYVAREQNHFLYEHYQQLNDADRILRSIIGTGRYNSSKTKLLNINERFQSVLPWMNENYNSTIYFERLVGKKGGGSDEIQIEELKKISDHMKAPRLEDNVDSIRANLFGGTRTFEKGVIGRWKECFNNMHKDVFKDVAGKLLVNLNFEKDFNW